MKHSRIQFLGDVRPAFALGFIVSWILIAPPLNAETRPPGSLPASALPDFEAEYLAETDGPRSLASVQNDPGFSALAPDQTKPGNPVWMRFRLRNSEDRSRRLYLQLDHPHLDRIEFFAPVADESPPATEKPTPTNTKPNTIPNNTKYKRSVTGDTLPFRHRPIEHRTFVFGIDAAPGTSTYYMRVQTRGLYRLDMRLWNEIDFFEHEGREKILFGLFFGGMLLIGLYHLLLAASTREKQYLFYFFWLANVSLFLLNLEGLAFQFLWPGLPRLTGFSNPLLLCLSVLSGPLFARAFLNTKKFIRSIDRLLLLSALSALPGLVLAFFQPFVAVRYGVAISIISVLVVSVAGPAAYLRGYRPARFYILANFMLLVTATVLAFSYFGPLSENSLTRYGLYLGLGLDAVLISLALADRINASNETLRLTALSRDYMQDILYSLNECIIVLRPNGLIRTCNPASRALIGYLPDELEGRSIEDFFASASPFRTGDNIDWKYDGIRRVPLHLRHRGGAEVPVYFTSSVMRNANNQIQGIICLAEEREASTAAHTAVDAAIDAAGASTTRNENDGNGANDASMTPRTTSPGAGLAPGNEVIDFSQQMRTPVHVILGMSRLLENARLTADERRYLALLRQGGENLLNMGDRLVSEGTGGESTLFHLEDLLDSLGELLALLAQERGLDLSIYIEPDVDLNLRGDAARLRLALTHLLNEALHRTHAGAVVLSVGRGSSEATQAGSHPALRFTLRRLPGDVTPGKGGQFPGQQTATEILTGIGGEVETPTQDPRNEFLFCLPLAVTSPGGWNRERRPLDETTRVLLADESSTHRATIREYLRGAGARVAETKSVDEAQNVLYDSLVQNEPFAFALVDARLLRQAGGERLDAALREQASAGSLGLLLMLGLGDREEIGANDHTRFLVKPIKRRELFAKLTPLDAANPAGPATRTTAALRGLRILLAEDNQDSQLLFQAYLQKTGHEVDIATNGEEAVHLFKTRVYDIVFMDMQMPVMDGFTAVFKIRKWEADRSNNPRAATVPIYALTAFSLNADIERSIRVGCTGHIAKPVSRETILELLSDTQPTGTDLA